MGIQPDETNTDCQINSLYEHRKQMCRWQVLNKKWNGLKKKVKKKSIVHKALHRS